MKCDKCRYIGEFRLFCDEHQPFTKANQFVKPVYEIGAIAQKLYQVKKEKQMLSKEDKLEIINVLEEAREKLISGIIQTLTNDILLNRIQDLRKRLIDKFIVDEGVSNEKT